MADLRLVLASGSPRRRELLGRFGLDFDVRPADIDESVRPDEPASDYVVRLAREKAATVTEPGTVVLAADTSVVLDGEILGKPRDHDDADAMLTRLAGRAHEVVTGMCLRVTSTTEHPTETWTAERTVVHLEDLGPDRIAWYLRTGEADDKAGAYGLQGAAALFADRVEGSVTNVIGLPLAAVDRLFRQVGLDLLDFGARR